MASFIEGPVALSLANASVAQRKALVLKDYVGYFGPKLANPVAYYEMNWPAEQWTAGAASFFTPPGVLGDPSFGEALRQPVGQIYWASTETAVRWTGYVDGGISSGQDNARAILARMGKALPPAHLPPPITTVPSTNAALPVH
jgi:monoamine oxidase